MKVTKNGIIGAGVIFCAFVFGVSSGHYKHFPFSVLRTIKYGGSNPQWVSTYEARNYNASQQVLVADPELTAKTGIYITYGQSNAANFGELGYDVKHAVYQSLLGNIYEYRDPSLGATGEGGSVWGMVGDKLIEADIHDQVIFANTAWGGKKLYELKEGQLLSFVILSYQMLIEKYGRVDGILFHQGESNNLTQVEIAEGETKNYYSEFLELVENLKTNGVEIPIYLSRTSLCAERRPINTEFTDTQTKLIVDHEIIKAGPNTDLLNDPEQRLPDYCHFSLNGFEDFSDMWLESLSQ